MVPALIVFSGLAGIAIWIVLAVAFVGIVYVVMRANGVVPPTWVVQIFWIVVVALVAILAIKVLVSAAF